MGTQKAAVVLAVVIWCLGACGPRAAPAQPPLPPAQSVTILRLAEGPPLTLPLDPQAERRALARIDKDALETVLTRLRLRETSRTREEVVLRLEVFAGEPLLLEVDSMRTERDTIRVIVARLQGRPGSAVLRYDGHLNGIVRTGSGDVIVRQYDGDLYLVTQLKAKLESSCAAPRSQPRPQTAKSVRKTTASLVDVLVMYTPSVLDVFPCVHAGGCSEKEKTHVVEDILSNAIEDVNLSLACSGVRMEVRLAGIELVDYQETGNIDTDLLALADGSIGPGEIVKDRRDAVSADLVAVIAGQENLFGSAIVYREILKAGKERAVSVTLASNVISTHTLAHEMAHNMGAGHDVPDGTGYYDFSRGASIPINPEDDRTTIMVVMNGQFRVPRFSGPSSRWGATIMGAASTDNVRTLNLNRATVEGFRTKPGTAAPYACPNP